MSQDKRAELFEYYKTIGLPKWVLTDGARLYKTLRDVPDVRIDAMHAQMIAIKVRDSKLKNTKKASMYKRWKSPLILFLTWGGFALYFANSSKPDLTVCMLYSFIAGSYFEELMINLIHNYIEKKFSKTEKVK